MSTVSWHTKGTARSLSPKRGWLQGALVGLLPLGFLVGLVTLTLAGAALARLLFAGAGFFAQQQAAVTVLIAGLILAIVVFGLTVWRVLRRVALWQQGGARMRAGAALWALGATALVIVVPVVLALLLPQHPAL